MSDNWPIGFDETGAELWPEEFEYPDSELPIVFGRNVIRSATITGTLTPEEFENWMKVLGYRPGAQE